MIAAITASGTSRIDAVDVVHQAHPGVLGNLRDLGAIIEVAR